MKRRTGFTLIELLIVVAIIAILAAIAVPNFLEAQVRAKVSRVQSDMRTIATALESYLVDNQRGPLCGNEASQTNIFPPAGIPGYTNQTALSCLTTPVAYMTSILTDPFLEKGGRKNGTTRLNVNVYVYRSYFQAYRWTPPTRPVPKMATMGYTWSLQSYGPSGNSSKPDMTGSGTLADMILGQQGVGIYDPSNGTVSYGWICRSNKGIVTGSDFLPR